MAHISTEHGEAEGRAGEDRGVRALVFYHKEWGIWLFHHHFWTSLRSYPSHDRKGKVLDSRPESLIYTGCVALDIDRNKKGKMYRFRRKQGCGPPGFFPCSTQWLSLTKERWHYSVNRVLFPWEPATACCLVELPGILHGWSSERWISGVVLDWI